MGTFFFAIVLFTIVTGCWMLYKGSCPSCHKLRARKREGSAQREGMVFSKHVTIYRCKYCNHRWEEDDPT